MNTYRDTTNIVVIIALPEEHDIFLEQFPAVGDCSTATLVRLSHDLGVNGYTLTSILSESMGSDSAASSTYAAVDDLHPDLVVCLGIAGSLSADADLGDVCISNEIIDVLHNAKIAETSRGSKVSQQLSPRTYPVNTALQSSCRFLRSHPALIQMLTGWLSSAKLERAAAQSKTSSLPPGIGLAEEGDTTFHVGPIICGAVSASKSYNERLKEINRKVLAIETESGGVFRVCQERGIPAITIRGISDRADGNKGRLENSAKHIFRRLATTNAVSFFKLQCHNVAFINQAFRHANDRRRGVASSATQVLAPEAILGEIQLGITKTLEAASPEYKNRPANAPLPLPRLRRVAVADEVTDRDSERPLSVYEAVSTEQAIFIKLPRSFPDQTLGWSIGQYLLSYELDGRQILPLVAQCESLSPPSRGLDRALDRSPSCEEVVTNFTPVLVLDEPDFESRTKLSFVIDQVRKFGIKYIIIVSKAETPVDAIDQFKTELGLSDFLTAPVPFAEIALYLELAFEMAPAEAEAVATRLDDTFSRFRLNTHPAYFIGL